MAKWNGAKIKLLSKSKGIRINTIAKYCGVTRQAVNLWINGKMPLGENLLKLTEILKCKANDFIIEDNTEIEFIMCNGKPHIGREIDCEAKEGV